MTEENPVLVLVEQGSDKSILPISLECVTTGRRLSRVWGCRLLALAMGHDAAGVAEDLSRYEVDIVCLAEHPLLEPFQPEIFASALRQVVERIKPRAVLMGDTLTSIDTAPRLAFSLNAGLITDCVGLELGEQGEEVLFIKPVYSSNVMAAYSFASEPYVLTMRSRSEEPPNKQASPVAEVIPVDVELDASTAGTEVIRRVFEEEEGPKLTSADIIVAGGRGMGGPEGFEQISDLARMLNAAVGASRPPCDLGWVSPKSQVGQTGEKVGPSVYIAVGISGATQHLAGMSGSGTIVAINKDPKANIFRIADYGVVGNHEEVLPAFKEAFSGMLNKETA